jgi:8-oxo-dGTP pyrophosphatase MutT (NUDIX family)
MDFPFDTAFRAHVAARCGSFRRDDTLADRTLKHAAVAITLVESEARDGQTAFLLTQRAANLRAHGAQYALPGGRCDPGETAVEAALRELHEELGVAADPADVLGVLDDYPTRSGYLVTPVVVWAGRDAQIVPNPAEVAQAHRIPLAEIAVEEAISFAAIPESDRPLVRLAILGDYIHAPTAALLYQFREIIAGRETRVAHLEQPVFAWR